MRKLNDMAIGGAVTTVVALICRLIFAECFGESYVESWGQYYVYLILGGCIAIGLILTNPDLTNPIRLVGNAFFGAGFGGLVMNKFVELCVNFNQPQSSILVYEIIAVISLFFVSGSRYSRKPKRKSR